MSSKTKHSKIRNTGILFELLTRQITVDVLNNDKKGSAANILKTFFNKNTQLGKEWIFHNDEDAKQKIFLSLKKVESMVTKIYKI